MTSLAAHNVGISDRGTIAPGMYADLTLFDPSTFIDRATTGAFPGRVIRLARRP